MQQGKFVVALTFDGCRNIRKFCTDEHTPYWLSWNIYGKTYQSDSFIPGEGGELPRFRDTVHVQCNANEDGTVPTQLCHGFPLRVFLCTNELVVAVAVVDPFDQNEAVPKTPLQFNAWLDLHPVAESAAPVGSSFLNVGVLILPEGSGAHPAEEGREDLSGEHSENGYEDDDFEDAGVAGPPPPPPPPIQSDTPTDKQQKNNNSFDDEADKMLRHFRVSVDVRSIGGLKRPAHVSVQFMYPFLGASSPVRSTPLWIQAYTEAKIDGAVASYECAMTRERITDILKTHPLRIAALSKSHLGNNILGEIHVDLAAANNTDPHSYRCPLTSRMFKTREDYSKHRQMMMSLMAAGRIDRAPARDPVVVRVVDAYLAVTPPAKGATTVDPSKSLNVYTGGVVQGDNTAKVRVVTIIEDIGAVGPETAITVRPGYKMHNGAVYQIDDDAIQLSAAADGNAPPSDPLARTDITPEQRAALNKLKLEWEAWRRATEAQWREAMYEKEAAMRKKVEQDGVEALADKADNLKRATEESNKLEVRLRMAIDAAERQKNTLALREEQMQVKLAQKTNELQLLQRRVRDEAKALVEGEKNKAEALSRQLAAVQESLKVAERRAKISEDDFEAYRLRMRGTPEAVLREENAKLRAQLAESKANVEKEQRLRSETALEKEHFRAQMHRLALALKREREKSSGIARQELEQLRLEFLAREERYVLDGDREELRTIRQELGMLRAGAAGGAGSGASPGFIGGAPGQPVYSPHQYQPYNPYGQPIPLTAFPHHHHQQQQGYTPSTPPRSSQTAETEEGKSHTPPHSSSSSSSSNTAAERLRRELQDLKATGLYDDPNDPVIVELTSALRRAESTAVPQ